MKKEGKIRSFNLSSEEIDLIEFFTNQQGFRSQSEFIGWLVRNYANSVDPIKQIQEIRDEKKKLQEKIKELEEKEEIALNKLKIHKENEKLKEQKTQEAIGILKRKIKEGAEIFEIENIARFWGFKLGKDSKELMFRAFLELKDEIHKRSQ